MVQRQNRYYISLFTYAIEDMVFGIVPVLCTLAWMFYKISFEVVVPYPSCYRFIRTVMEKLLSSLPSAKLGGLAEGDEFYIKVELKGRPYHNEIVKAAGRKPRKRGLKPWRGRGTLQGSSNDNMHSPEKKWNDIF